MRREWRVREPDRDILIVSRLDASPEERRKALVPAQSALRVSQWFSDWLGAGALNRGRVVDLLGIVNQPHAAPWDLPNVWIQKQLGAAFETGRLLAIPVALPVASGFSKTLAAPAEAEPPPPPPGPDELTWVEIELVDLDGKPVPGRKYKVTLSSGIERVGSLNNQGLARIESIDPGSCKVSFPDIDGREWKAG